MTRKRTMILSGMAMLAAAGLGAGVAVPPGRSWPADGGIQCRGLVPRGGAVVPRRAHWRRHACRNSHLHRRQPGSYQYLCPVPGHAREGMAGILTVR
jgi:DNA-binding transcriptional LysR family regulator